MNIFGKKNITVNERPSVLLKLRLVDKLGLPVDESTAWLALKNAFKDHPHLEVSALSVWPDKYEEYEKEKL